ncbi:hypothetical protein LH464_15635 [Neorhizobium sp. T786]|uniref:hypothetical protein n=1 Tax=Pseudorhizobium xiangyangii TaxID=2883104 RepID=UPI001CFFC394|nr:hypothetical protein [Neorhizobium xiangyangii]MCB5203903.1 hypothetical protein [Neorhizobium xiangyangii]
MSLNSNGFGSWRQEIIFYVPRRSAAKLSAMDAFTEIDSVELERACFVWQATSQRRGDDEQVVFSLHQLLAGTVDLRDWQIDWSRSRY